MQYALNGFFTWRILAIKVGICCITWKVPLCPESLSYQKKDGRTGPRLPFFWYDTDFSTKKKKKKKELKKNFFFYKKNLKSRCHTNSHRLRPLGTFWCNATHVYSMSFVQSICMLPGKSVKNLNDYISRWLMSYLLFWNGWCQTLQIL